MTHGTVFDADVNNIISIIKAADKVAGSIVSDPVLQNKKATAIIATGLIKQFCPRYAALRRDLANAFALGDDKYRPRNPTAALGLLNAYVNAPTRDRGAVCADPWIWKHSHCRPKWLNL